MLSGPMRPTSGPMPPLSPPLRPLPSPPRIFEKVLPDGSSIFKFPDSLFHIHVVKDGGHITDETKRKPFRNVGPAPSLNNLFLSDDIKALLDRIAKE